jgi:hypothetical protein
VGRVAINITGDDYNFQESVFFFTLNPNPSKDVLRKRFPVTRGGERLYVLLSQPVEPRFMRPQPRERCEIIETKLRTYIDQRATSSLHNS